MSDASDGRSDKGDDGDGPEEFDPPGRSPTGGTPGSGAPSGPDRGAAGGPADGEPPGVSDLRDELDALRADLDDFEADVESRTVHREDIESELRRYVRRRQRRGHARGWGPYLVLLYGTAMTLGAFYFLSSGYAILAMIVIWLSTLGLYVFMIVVGAGLSLLGVPGRLRDAVGRWRS